MKIFERILAEEMVMRVGVFRPLAAATVIVTGLSLIAGAIGIQPDIGRAEPVTAAGLAGGAGSSESVLARESGRAVEVVGERSESRQVFANPDGTFSAKVDLEPVRVRRNNGWVRVDPTLRVNRDRTVSPVATPVSLAFSGGGVAPLVRLTQGGR